MSIETGPESTDMQDDGWFDPLAVKVGIWGPDIQDELWPDTFDPDTCERILGYLSEIDQYT